MKSLPLIAFILLVGCGQQKGYQCKEPISEDSLASIERSLIPENLKDSIDWSSITMTSNEVKITKCINDRELQFIKDSVRRRGIHPNITIDVRGHYVPGAKFFTTN